MTQKTSNIIGLTLANMTIDSIQRIVNWKCTTITIIATTEVKTTAMNVEEAYEKQNWLFVFKATIATHLPVDVAVDKTTILQRQDMQLNKLMKLKHVYCSLEKCIMKLKNQSDVCQALGCTINDKTKCSYFMENLNSKIFK